MKAKINYKSRKTIIIIAIAVILVIAAIAGTVAFIKGNNNAAAAMPEDEQTTIGDAQNNNGGDANQNDGNPSENPSDNPQTELPAVEADNNGTTTEGNNGTTGTTNGGTTTNGNGTGTTTGTTTGTAGTGTTVPNQDYTQTTTVITENPWETKTIGWSPLSISAYTAAANLGINKPELSSEKLAYVQGDSLKEAPVHTAIQKGEVITYVIKVTNKGNLDATSIRTIDTVPAGTELVDGSITANGTESNGKITWKTDIEAGKTVELSFQVSVVADSINLIENTAKVNGTETPTTQNPVITSDKQASVVIVKGVEEALEDRDAKVGETIRYTIKAINKSEVDGTTIITDKVPEGTTYVADSASEGAVVADDGTITWEKVTVPAGEEVTVSFDVTVNQDTKTSVTNIAVVGDTETPETETKVANITGTKSVDKTTAKVGDTLTYTITLTNSGNADGKVTVTDEIPAGTRIADATVEGYDAETNTMTWADVEVKANGGTATLTLEVVIKDDTTTTVKNVAKIDDKEIPETPETKVANITTTKSSVGIRNGQQLEQGATLHEFDVIEYTLTATNSGNGEGSVVISDEVPAGTTLVPGSIKLDGTGSYTEQQLKDGISVSVGTTPRRVTFKVTVNKLTEAEVHIKNEVAKQDGTTITPGTDDKVEKEYVTVTANKDFVDNNGVDGKRPASVELELYADGKTTGKTATTDANWKVEFTQLDKYTEAGQLIKYSVKENNVNEYYEDTYSTPVVEGNHTTIKVTNTLRYEMIKIPVEATKVWDDGDNKAEVRPDSVEFELYADNATTTKKQTVNKVENSNEWKTTFEGVNKYTPAGKEIEYSVKETTTPAHYNKQENGLTVTNKIDYTSIPTTVTAAKNWDDAENANRPTEVVIGAYNGSETPVKTAKANAGNNWTATFEGLQKYTAEGKKIEYTFKEVTVPEGYVATVKDNVITNALPRIEVTKTVKSINGEDATTVNSSTVKENDIIEYQITVKNTGSVTVNNITVTESLNVYLDANKPDEKTTSVGTISELKANESQTFTVYYKVVAEDVDNVEENLVNVATATGKYTDGNGNEKDVTGDGEISVTPTEINDLSITKSQKVNEKDVTTYTKVVPEDVITYTIIVKNTGNTVLNNVEVTDSMLTNSNFVLTDNGGFTLENGKLKIASLALNETKTITAKYTVQESDMSETVGTIANTATAKSDKAPEETSEVEVPTEAWYADISTTKTSAGSASPLHELDTITYTLTATNKGTDDGTVKLSDTVPTGTTLVENSIKIGNTTYTETQLNNGIEVHLDAGETKTLTFSVTINPFESATINVVNNTATQDGTPIPATTDKVEKEYTSVTVNKTWVDNATQAQRRPDKIRFELYADNNNEPTRYYDMSKTETSYTFENLSKYNSDGTTITYTIQEKEINTGDLKFYTSVVGNPTVDANGKTYNVTNTFTKPTDTTKITVRKIWNDNTNAASKRPDSVKLHLNDEEVVLTTNNATTDGNVWSIELTKPVYNDNGEEITYTLTEKEENIPQWYTASVDGYTVTNTFNAPTDQKYDITITKVWNDNKNVAGKRPENITLTLNKIDVAGNTVKVKDVTLTGDSKAEQWTATENVQKYDEKANVIKYFVTEESTGSMFYVNTDTDTPDLTVTNKFVVPTDKAELTVRKVWNDNNNTSKRTPVTIRVTGNGKSEDVTLTSNNANANNGNIWEKQVNTLPKYDSLGNVISYTFDEVTVPTGYIKTVNGNEIINSLPGIKVTKTAEKVNDQRSGVNQITVKENDVIEYKITVENLGTVELTNVNVTDNLDIYTDPTKPENTTHTLLTNGTLAVEETKTYTVYYKVSANDVKVGGQTLRNIATATGEYKDSNNVTQKVEHEDTADVTIADAPGVEIEKTQTVKRNGNTLATDAKVQPGDVINYTITVTNTGNIVLNNVTVTDSMTGKEGFTITSGSLNIGTLGIAPNNVVTITATYTVKESDMQEKESKIANTATVKTSSTPDGSSTVEVPTEAWYADINVTKSSELIKNTTLGNKIAGKAEYGDTIKYTITATNSGKKAGTVVVKDAAPEGTTPVESDIYTAISSENGYTLAVPANGTASVSFDVTVTSKPKSTITNTATVDGNPVTDPETHQVEKSVSVKMTPQIPTIKNSNVVIVLDISGSMNNTPEGNSTWDSKKTRLYAAKQACNSFIDAMFKDDATGCKVSVVTFSSDTKTTGWGPWQETEYVDNAETIGTATSSTEATTLKNKISRLSADGGTRIAAGINLANTEINNLAKGNDNKNIVIVLSDGDFKDDNNDGTLDSTGGETTSRVETASLNLKNSACNPTVYAVAFASSQSGLMQNTIASDSNKTFKTASNYATLLTIFNEIGSELGKGEIQDVASVNGLIELPGLDANKDVTIKLNGETTGTTGKVSTFGNKIVENQDTGVYYLDTTQFDADAKIEIEYFEVQSQS